MWVCGDCMKQFNLDFRAYGKIFCPFCGSDNAIRMEEDLLVTTDDAAIINSLVRCGVEWPTIFSLVYGTRKDLLKALPDECRRIISDISVEITKKEECLDPKEKKIHSIIIDLLQVLYEKGINDFIEKAKKEIHIL